MIDNITFVHVSGFDKMEKRKKKKDNITDSNNKESCLIRNNKEALAVEAAYQKC